MTLPLDLPTRLRKHGLTIVEIDGWKTRGRPASTGGFAPAGVLCHHTASSENGRAAIPLLVGGRSDLPGPLCQLSLDRQGVVYVVASGRANHAGVAKRSGTMAGGDGNVLYIGIEAQNRGTGEPWPKAQYDAYVTLAAALCVEITGNSAQTVRAHKETSVTGKIDPAGPTPYEHTFDMDKFRARVAAAIKTMTAAQPKPSKKPKPKTTRSYLGRRLRHGRRRPEPILGRVANCASVSTAAAKSRDTFTRALTTPGELGLPSIVFCEEMSDVDAAAVCAEVGGWAVSQHGKVGSPDSALAVAYRVDRVRSVSSVLEAGTAATHEGGGIRRRPILVEKLEIDHGTPHAWRLTVGVGHAAPSRAPKDRTKFLSLFKALSVALLAGDLNILGPVARALFGVIRRVYTIGVLHLALSRWIPAKGPKPVDHGSDHQGVDVLLWP